ncbi:hypothetical protein SNE40_003293 [Patella caerulea]|uniref:Ankyrin repeat protein n=1 Tax=Patella caerulea TaxID=87958 RepID=A0AAN8KHS6_PATCE
MAMFKFLSAVRSHLPVEEIELFRIGAVSCDEEYMDITEAEDTLYPPLEALRFAIMYSHLEYARFLLQNYGAAVLQKNLCCPLLLLAVRLNDEPMVILICQYSASITEKTRINYLDSRGCELMENGKTALHAAAELGLLGCTRILLQHGADHTQKDCDGLTPLHRALQKFKASYNVFLCIMELLKCERQIHGDVIPKIQALHEIHHAKHNCIQCGNVPSSPQPTSLLKLSRCSILNLLGPRISLAIPLFKSLLPVPVLKYVNFEGDD